MNEFLLNEVEFRIQYRNMNLNMYIFMAI